MTDEDRLTRFKQLISSWLPWPSALPATDPAAHEAMLRNYTCLVEAMLSRRKALVDDWATRSLR
jgi:hypothetical protein